MMKRVSVVLCTYNGARFLRQQLDSVLAQTYPLHELIIQDDGSTDETLGIISEYSSSWSCIRFYKNESQHGINGNFYSAMRRATGDLIAICDQDDIWEPEKLAIQVEAIGEKLLCAGRSKPFSEDGSFVYCDSRMPNITLLRMLYCAEIAGHTMLVRKDILNLLPSDCNAVRFRCYDIVFSVVASAYDSIIYIDKVLVHQRRYASASTYTSVEDSLPTAQNAFKMIWWCLRHYRIIKIKSRPVYEAWLNLLESLNITTTSCRNGIRMMQLQKSLRVIDLISLSFFCLRHREEICHTRGRFPSNVVRALLYPITSCYYQRALILESR